MPELTSASALTPPLPLVCYGNIIYERLATHYCEVAEEQLKIRVTRYLKTQGLSRLPQSLVDNTIACIKAECLLEGNRPMPFYTEFDESGRLEQRKYLALRNGIIDIEELERGIEPILIPHSANWISTTVLPYRYDPDARAPGWIEFLGQVLPRLRDGDRRIRLLQEWFGYNLLPDARFHRFVMLHGQGANGKTVVLDMLRRLLGPENTSEASLEQLGKQFGLQGLLGKVANICGDLSETKKVDEGKLKELTGGEAVCVPRKYKTDAKLISGIKFTFACNTLPVFNDKSGGLWRRYTPIPFLVDLPERNWNSELANDLTPELPGILNWSLIGLRRLLNRGRFTRCDVCDEAKNQHRVACNPFAQFMGEVLPKLSNSQRERYGSTELYRRYRNWCEHAGYAAASQRTFAQNIERLPTTVRRWNYNGIAHFQFTPM